MRDDAWQAVCLLLENGWPGEFDDAARGAYRVLLDGYEPEQLLAALRVLVRRGARFRPSAGEIVAEIVSDPGRPTWGEAYRLLFGQRGLLTVNPEEACLRRADERHPLLAAFIRQEGYDRLRLLQIHDPDRGELIRRNLEHAWALMEQRASDRIAAGLELDHVGRPRQIGPRKPDYLKSLPSAEAPA